GGPVHDGGVLAGRRADPRIAAPPLDARAVPVRSRRPPHRRIAPGSVRTPRLLGAVAGGAAARPAGPAGPRVRLGELRLEAGGGAGGRLRPPGPGARPGPAERRPPPRPAPGPPRA